MCCQTQMPKFHFSYPAIKYVIGHITLACYSDDNADDDDDDDDKTRRPLFLTNLVDTAHFTLRCVAL